MFHWNEKLKTFGGFPWVVTSTRPGGSMMCLCVYFITGAPEGSTESGSGQARNRNPATHGLQGIGIIHYTTAVSLKKLLWLFPGL